MPSKVDLSKIPAQTPGCYLFFDSSGKVIYVGKAKDLKKRVSSYFRGKHDPKTEAMVSRISSVDYIATSSESEALVLENNLVKSKSPKYNIDLKDSKRYGYLRFTPEDFPRLVVSRVPGLPDQFGPFVSGSERELSRQAITKIFRIRTCRKMPKKACLRRDLFLCDAPCIGAVSKENYLSEISLARKVLSGNSSDAARLLEREMKDLSKRGEYELAIKRRDQLSAIGKLSEKRQVVEREALFDEDVIAFAKSSEGSIGFVVLGISRGLLLGKRDYEFSDRVFSENPLEDFIPRLYSDSGKIPAEIVVESKVSPAVSEYLSKVAGRKVSISVPVSGGEKGALLSLAKKNAELLFVSGKTPLAELKASLGLDELPETIECFDISHFAGSGTVGSMVQFKNGMPFKEGYRRFRIKSLSKGEIDDFKSIGEIVYRRYSRLVSEGSPLPNLIVVDGGKGQLSAAKKSLASIMVRVPIVSLAKRDEEVFLQSGKPPLRLDRRSHALKLLQRIRDEAHRFAISYNRLLRSKSQREGLKK